MHSDLKVITKKYAQRTFISTITAKISLTQKIFSENNSHLSTHLHKNVDLTFLSQKFREIILLIATKDVTK